MKTINDEFDPVKAMIQSPHYLKTSMRKMCATICAGLILSGAAVLPGHAAGVPTVKLHGHVPAQVLQSKVLGGVSPTANLSLSIGLPLRNREGLTNLLQQMYDPASANYHHYLTAAEFTDQFGPTKQDYDMVINFARVNGLKVTGTHPNRMLLEVSGKASDIERAFQVNLKIYQHPKENGSFFAPDKEPSVPATLPVQDISGLDNFRRPQTYFKYKSVLPAGGINSVSAKASAVAPNATTGSGPNGNYIGDDFRNAYVPGTPLKGSGQAIALVQFDGYLASDIVAYATAAGRTNIPLQNVLIDGFNGQPTGSGGDVEVSLDIEMVMSMAPALSKIIVYEGNPFNFHPNNVLNRIATDNLAKQVSCSWGWTGGPTVTTDQIFQQMALQGQSFFTASGDSDAYPAGTVDSPFNFGTPSDSPYLTSVGGTTLTMGGAGSTYASETVWNWGLQNPADDGIGSSGGISSFYTIPSWQTNINMAARGGSQTTRNFPDVAMTADDVYVIASGGAQYIGVGGTSVAAPLWAGFTALANQQATNTGHAPIGFLNPAIYSIATTPDYTNCFRDVTVGNNTWSGSPNLFYATNNYDLCTGLGTPRGTNLINALVAVGGNTLTHLSPPAPNYTLYGTTGYGSSLSVLNGGNPNGTWQLFVQDDALQNSGIISNGWILTLTTANPVGFSANLALGMSVSATAVTISNDFSYTLSVANYGPSASSNVVVSDTLPLGISVISSNVPSGTTLVRSGQQLNWNIGTLATNGSLQLVFTVRANTLGSFVNYATATASTADANPDDNFASVVTTVAVPASPQISGPFAYTNGAFQLTISGPLNPAYPTIIQASTNLVNWVDLYTNTPPFTYTDPAATNYPLRFYRAVVSQ